MNLSHLKNVSFGIYKNKFLNYYMKTRVLGEMFTQNIYGQYNRSFESTFKQNGSV